MQEGISLGFLGKFILDLLRDLLDANLLSSVHCRSLGEVQNCCSHLATCLGIPDLHTEEGQIKRLATPGFRHQFKKKKKSEIGKEFDLNPLN